MFIGWVTNKIGVAVAKEELLKQLEETTRNVHAPFHMTQVSNDVFNEQGIIFTSNVISQEEADNTYQVLLKEKFDQEYEAKRPTSEQIVQSANILEESMNVLSVNAINIVIEPVWATVDGDGEFAYVDVYTSQEEAEGDIGKEVEEGIVIRGVKQGWHIRGVEDFEQESKDFYETYQDAEFDLNERILKISSLRG